MGLTHAGRPDSPHYPIPEAGTRCTFNSSRDHPPTPHTSLAGGGHP